MTISDMSFGNFPLCESKTSKKAVPKYKNLGSKDMAGCSLAGIFSTNHGPRQQWKISTGASHIQEKEG